MRIFHPSLVADATLESNSEMPYQQRNESFDAWAKKTKYHRLMSAFSDDIVMNLGEIITQKQYINKLHNGERIREIEKLERHSSNPREKQNYTAGYFLAYLRGLDTKCN